MRLFGAAILLLVLAVVAWALAIQPDRSGVVSPPRFIEGEPTGAKRTLSFEDITLDLGLTTAHQQNIGSLTALTETLGGGVCVVDVNRDGWQDLLLVGGSGNRRHYGRSAWWVSTGGTALLLNRSGQSFEDVSEHYGISADIWGMGCATGDLDNDGDFDLIVYGRGQNAIYRNDGEYFQRIDAAGPLARAAWTTGALLSDFNRDGLLDIYFTNFVKYEQGINTFEAFSGFDVASGRPFDATLYDADSNQLLVNRGDFVFEDATVAMGVGNAQGRSLGGRWIDLNDDDWMDLLIVNEHGTPNAVFVNREGTLDVAGRELSPLAMAGSRDIHRLPGHAHRYVFSRGAGVNNALLARSSTGPLRDISRQSELGSTEYLFENGWGIAGGDFDLDGAYEIYVANGMVEPDVDSDFVATGQSNAIWGVQGSGLVRLSRPGVVDQNYSSRGVVASDLDNDGRLEIVVGNNNDAFRVLKPVDDSAGRWLVLEPVLSDVAREGASLVIEVDGRRFERDLSLAQSFLSQGDRRVHVGLGDVTADTVTATVRFRGGRQTIWDSVPVDRIIRLEPDGTHEVIGPTPASRRVSVPRASGFDVATLDMLIDAYRATAMADSLDSLWEQGDKRTRVHILDRLSRDDGTIALTLMSRAVTSPERHVVVSGLGAARRMEFDASVDWLVALVAHGDAGLSCEASKVLTDFYQEEEAAIRRKFLAVKTLTEQLGRDDAAAGCAARALAVAERKRTVGPLIEALATTSPANAIEVVRALGLVRDTSAIEPLGDLLETSESAAVRAASAIALVRLGRSKEEVLSWIAEVQVAPRLALLNALYESEDTAVFSRNSLQPAIARAIEDAADALLRSPAGLLAMGYGRDPAHHAVLSAAARDERADRRAAWQGLAAAGADPSLFQPLVDEPVAMVNEVLRAQPNIRLLPATIVALTANGVSMELLAGSISLLGGASLGELIAQMVEEGLESETMDVLELCAQSNVSPPGVRETLAVPVSIATSPAAIRCLLYKGGRARSAENLQRRVVANQLLRTVPEPERDRLRWRLAVHDEFFAADHEVPASVEGIAFLASQGSEAGRARLRQWAGDASLPLAIRIHAIDGIVDEDADEARGYLMDLAR